MKNIYILLAVIGLSLVSFKGQAQTITYNEAFIQNQTATTQCTAWGVFRSQLLASYCYTGFTMRGSQDMTGITCTDPIVATAVANALRTATNYSGTSNSITWTVNPGCGSGCGNGVVELHTWTNDCQCATGYIVRPEIANQNWGGINGPTCNAVSQTLIVEFFYAPAGAPTVTCPSNVTVNNDAGNCDAVVNYTMPTVFSCDSYTTTQTAGLASGSAFPVGTTTNTFSYTNGSGTSTCSFTVTVVDAENPTITCPGPIT
ncbi:MAG: HYR domain-containing protein, partial [Vicingaceae bacterium]|nr:HYR domain-containing protein [Vicingaceae bacterium]